MNVKKRKESERRFFKKKKIIFVSGAAVSRMVNDWRELIENCLSLKIQMAQTKNQK